MEQHPDGSWENPATATVDPTLSLPALFFERARQHPGQVAVERRTELGVWTPVTIDEMTHKVEEYARGLIGLGIQPGEHVAILAATSYEWALLDLAALAAGAITVPIYESDSAAQIEHILTDAQIVMVVTEASQQADLVASVATPGLRSIISLDRGAERIFADAARAVAPLEVEARMNALRLDDLATIIYTSGTTGMPKGVELTHGNFVTSFLQAHDFLPDLISNPRSRTLLFLPLAHVLARFVMYALLTGQGRVGFSPDTRNLVADIGSFRPTLLLAVPRVLEKVYNAASMKAGGGVTGSLFSWSAKQARDYSQSLASGHRTSPGLQARYRAADALVLGKVRKIFGPNLKTIVCGGAPLSPDLANFFRGTGVTVLQGYGLSESTGPISVEVPDDCPPDSVGFVWPGNSMRVAEDGELLLKGVSVFRGYHNLPEATATAIRDGWFHTGDLATIDDQGHLRITGRKKGIIVTAAGKNVSPEVLEKSLATPPLISQVVVVGDGRPYIGALIVLDPDMLPGWLHKKGLQPVEPAAAAELPEVRDSLDRAINKANRQVSRAESIRRYRIINAAFTVENGYLTPSLKLKRNRVLIDFAGEIDALYLDGEREKRDGLV